MTKATQFKHSLRVLSLLTCISSGYAGEDFKPIEPTTTEDLYSKLLSLSLSTKDLSSKKLQEAQDAIYKSPDFTGKDILAPLLNFAHNALKQTTALSSGILKKLLREQLLPAFSKNNLKTVRVAWVSTENTSVDPDGVNAFLEHFPPDLENLYLINIPFDSDSLSELVKKISKTKKLKTLQLVNTGMTPEIAGKMFKKIPETLEYIVLDESNPEGKTRHTWEIKI
jgi:hypothetical protein